VNSIGATQTPAAEAPLIANVSGIPPCTEAPREPLDLDVRQQYRFLAVLEGTPSVTLVEPGPDEYGLLHAPVIWLDELPAGSTVDAGYPAAVLRAVGAQLKSCARLRDDRESIYDIANIFHDGGSYAALLSDCFPRRPWVVKAMGMIGYEGIALQVPVPVIGDDVATMSG